MGYSRNALKAIIKASKELGIEENYVELWDGVTNLGEFDIYEAIDIYNVLDHNLEAICARCLKAEIPKEDDDYGAETGIYHCRKCREEIPLKEYFNSLKSKGLLEQYGKWIMKVYPEFSKYVNSN